MKYIRTRLFTVASLKLQNTGDLLKVQTLRQWLRIQNGTQTRIRPTCNKEKAVYQAIWRSFWNISRTGNSANLCERTQEIRQLMQVYFFWGERRWIKNPAERRRVTEQSRKGLGILSAWTLWEVPSADAHTELEAAAAEGLRGDILPKFWSLGEVRVIIKSELIFQTI